MPLAEIATLIRRNALPAGMVALGILLLLSALFGTRGLGRVLTLKQEVRATAERNFAILQENVADRDKLHGLRGDAAELERTARDRLHLVRDGDTLYRWEPAADGAAPDGHSLSSAHSAKSSSYSSESSRSSSPLSSRSETLSSQPSR